MTKDLRNVTASRDELNNEILERKTLEEKLKKESNLRDILLDNLPCIALILKKGTREIVASNKMAKEVGAVPGKTCYQTCAKRSSICTFCRAPELWEDGKPQHIEVEHDGTYYEGIWVPYSDDLYVHYIFDITARKKAEKKLERMAYYDQLTQIPNRANFLSHINRLLQRTKQQSDYMFAVLFIDLDRFKIINDSLGHEIGDRLLIEIAQRLETCTRPTDQISLVEENDSIARFGGDEFAILLHDVKDISSASRVADRLQAELQEPIIVDRHELYTSASIGIAMSATGYESAEDMLRDADSAMYRAKATGKAHAEIFDEAMHIRVTEILDLEYDLRFAVETEQFIVNYQPIVSATDRRITGAEALIRWDHPEKGVISPQDFIPIAEETGLISDIGEWVLRTACAQNKAWQDAGYLNILMKVNFSSRQFKDENLTEMVTKVIKETGMPAPLLDIEITESIAMADSSILILNQMTAMGLQTSIDDFGTGYSSLGSLTKFPINTIKIDKEFIQKITIDVNAQAIIKAIIAMAHSLHIEVIAEGVETEDELVFLQSQKCDKIQGYLFSRPVPEEEFRKLLEKEKSGNLITPKPSASIV